MTEKGDVMCSHRLDGDSGRSELPRWGSSAASTAAPVLANALLPVDSAICGRFGTRHEHKE